MSALLKPMLLQLLTAIIFVFLAPKRKINNSIMKEQGAFVKEALLKLKVRMGS